MTNPPIAPKRPHAVASPHGTRHDDYFWLRDDAREDPDVLAHLRSENAYRDALLAPVQGLRRRLFDEIVARIKQDDDSVPFRDRGYYYYRRFVRGGEYPIYARRSARPAGADGSARPSGADGSARPSGADGSARPSGADGSVRPSGAEGPGSLDAPEQIMLDGNAMAAGREYFSIGGWEIAPGGRLLAFAEDTVGRRQFTIRVKDLDTGMLLPDAIENASTDLAWAADAKTVFYVEKDPVTLLSVRVKAHILGESPAEDAIVYEEPDHTFYVSLGTTTDRRYVLVHSSSTVSDEIRFLPAETPRAPLRVLLPRERHHEYNADHMSGRWIVRTNWNALDFRLMEVSDEQIARRPIGDRTDWRELVGPEPGVAISGFQLFDDHLAIQERRDGLARIRIRPWQGGNDTFVTADEVVYSASLEINAEQNTPWLRYSYTSPKTPPTTFEIHMNTGERRLLKQQEVLGGFVADNYETERVWAVARDGTRIPVSLVYRRGLVRDGSAPLYLYGYGSYGLSMDPVFRSGVVSLLDRGFVFATAHVRGGQEMGRAWYEQGKLLAKMNTFTDFIDVTETLIQQKFCALGKVVAGGGSAGGMLVAAAANMRPDLYAVIVAHVPFVDIVTTMLDESIPLTTNEYDEWGHPGQKAYYDTMLAYSPYDNVKVQSYPAIFATTGLWDSQVQYYEPAKWIAKLRELNTGSAPIILSVNLDAGHGGLSGRFRGEEERAMEYAFILQQLQIAQ